jgi:hypothetical protein
MAAALHVTGHAIERYQERVANLPARDVNPLIVQHWRERNQS